jgi:thiamine biosynthesis protein ThiS
MSIAFTGANHTLGEFRKELRWALPRPFEPDPVSAGGGKRTAFVIMRSRVRGFFSFGDTMKIVVNGEEKVVDSTTVQQLLESLAIDPRRVAVEHNRSILPKKAYDSTPLAAGDSLEIVHFVGGG